MRLYDTEDDYGEIILGRHFADAGDFIIFLPGAIDLFFKTSLKHQSCHKCSCDDMLGIFDKDPDGKSFGGGRFRIIE